MFQVPGSKFQVSPAFVAYVAAGFSLRRFLFQVQGFKFKVRSEFGVWGSEFGVGADPRVRPFQVLCSRFQIHQASIFRIAVIFLLLLPVFGCTLTPNNQKQSKNVALVQARFTTMGLRIGEGSFYRETDIEIYQNGNAYQHIRDNGISENREYHLSANELAELLDFISSRLSKLPSQIGSFASDSDFGAIILREKNFIRSVSLEGGAWQGPKDQVKLFYESMEKILNVFASSNPVHLNYESE